MPQWTPPPCPHPTTQWARPSSGPRPAGILGQHPQHSYATVGSTHSYAPTDIESALHTMTLTQPDPAWYMNTGASSHMTSTNGNLSSYFNLSNHNSGIIVGSGHTIPIRGCGNATLSSSHPPLSLNNVLHAPKIIKNLISVRKFTTDNSVTVEFDLYGFFVKDFQTGMALMRCESQGDLYPLSPITFTTSPSVFAAVSSPLWHARLDHTGASILDFLKHNKCIECNSPSSSTICHSCILGKQIKLPFARSNNATLLPFDIVHSDLWTSPILSTMGHRYYVLFLDDLTNYLWTFPLARKSDVYTKFLAFEAQVHTQFEREIKNVQCDNGREYDQFGEFCESHGMSFRLSCPHTSSQNGKAERKIRSINNIIRTLLTHASIPPLFWHHALQMATYLLNILPSKLLAHKSPLEALYHRKP